MFALPREARRGTLPSIARRLDTFLFAITLFTSAFLLFAVQPMVGRLLLPRVGGAPAVWNTCMVFFQACLLGGYAYAHVATRRVPRVARQAALHVVLLAAAAAIAWWIGLPAMRAGGAPPPEASPIPWLLVALVLTAGPTFFVLAGTTPLLQRWFATASGSAVPSAASAAGEGYPARQRDPYFLYAAGNAGSLLALLAYPLLIEPRLGLDQQIRAWHAGYAGLGLMCVACAIRIRARHPDNASHDPPARPADPHITASTRLRWGALAFVPSSYLLGVTTFISTDIAAFTLLWVAPLAVYLLTFVLAFAARPAVAHARIIGALPATTLAVAALIMARASQPVWLVLAAHLLAFFVAAMACHGELARLRPPPQRLTDFYLTLSAGGALGGAFNALIAPVLFDTPIEYPIAIALTCLVALRAAPTDTAPPSTSPPMNADARAARVHRVLDILLPLLLGLFAGVVAHTVPARTDRPALPLVLLVLAIPAAICWTFRARPRRFAAGVAALLVAAVLAPPAHAHVLDVRRSFFGVHRVLRTRDGQFNQLVHGTTMHGAQRVDPASGKPTAPASPTSYYHEKSPFADLMAAVAPSDGARPRVGVVGLGAGSLAGFATDGWEVTFFEIDPLVRWAAEQSGHFTFISAARGRGARVETVLGDARLRLARHPDRAFDLLVLDAFSGDSIPAHLLTREAFATYLPKLRDRGLLAIHITNQYLDLRPVVAALAADARCAAVIRDDPRPPPQERSSGAAGSRVVVLARSAEALRPLSEDPRWQPLRPARVPPKPRPPALWTDDYSNLIRFIRWDRVPD